MPTSPWKKAGSGASLNYGGGAASWSNPGNIVSDNGMHAVCFMFSAGTSQHLRATQFGFTTGDIPTGATIEGIEVRIDRFALGTLNDHELYLVKGTANSAADHKGSNKASASAWPGSDATATYGGASDSWSAGLNDADTRSGDFGVTLRIVTSGGASANVDHVEIRVHYSEDPVYDDDLSETATAGSSFASTATLAVSRAESVSASESYTGGLLLTEALNEALSALDVYVGSLGETFAADIAESVAASDGFTAAGTFSIVYDAPAYAGFGIGLSGWLRESPMTVEWNAADPGATAWTPVDPTQTDWSEQ